MSSPTSPASVNSFNSAEGYDPNTPTLQHNTGKSIDKQFRHRRKHKNSKLGCPNCKKRRVKCSEHLPSCLNCIKHSVKCGYLEYTEEQLEELKAAKLDNEFDNLTTDPRDSSSSPYTARTSHSIEVVRPKLASRTSKVPSNSSYSSESSYTPKLSLGSSESSYAPQHIKKEPNEPGADLDSILNFQSQSVHQGYDNLLGGSQDEVPIIYPVYSINNPLDTTEPWAKTPLINDPLVTQIPPQKNWLQDLANQNVICAKTTESTSALPGAKRMITSFSWRRPQNINYTEALMGLLNKHASSVSSGTATLSDIRYIYYTWLNTFIYESYQKDMLFSCLLNLTTNYLISTCFENCPVYRHVTKDAPQDMKDMEFFKQHKKESECAILIEKSKLKNTAIVKSIKHYAKVIKDLRTLLNENSDARLCSSVSYILSLMSIYDPEATLNSILCFRDGLFSILTHNINISVKSKQKISIMVPIHLRLLKNTVRSVYLPSYDPTFLTEYQSMLTNFEAIVMPAITHVKHYVKSNGLPSRYSLRFVELKLGDLQDFVKDVIEKYLPKLSGTLDNIENQQQTLFDMIHRWVRLCPSKLSVINKNSRPFEKILYLFYKVLKKALFAIFPQVKFFFLRDFDSPIMSDVFDFTKDKDIVAELADPLSCGLLDDLYRPMVPPLQKLASYLVRIISYLQARLNILYRQMVYDPRSVELFPIDDVREWRNSITDIGKVRHDYNRVFNLQETCIKSFAKTVISEVHYPHSASGPKADPDGDIQLDVPEIELAQTIDDLVDFGPILPTGFYEVDYNWT